MGKSSQLCKSIPYLLMELMRVGSIQLKVPTAEAADLLHHAWDIMTLELHVTDIVGHPVGKIILHHDDPAQPVILTGDDAVFGCAGYVGAGMGELDDEEVTKRRMLTFVIQHCREAADAARLWLNSDVHIVDNMA